MFKAISRFIKARPEIWYILYFPIYAIAYLKVDEYCGTVTDPIISYLPIDDYIPFCEYFIVPYVLWLAYMIGVGLLLFITDTRAYKRMMWLYILGFSLGITLCALFPAVQLLRPETFPRDNVFTDAVRYLYSIDNNATVLPSLHVVGALIAASSLLISRKWRANLPLQICSLMLCVLICLATVCLKQHSALDVFAAFGFFAPILAAVVIVGNIIEKKRAQ